MIEFVYFDVGGTLLRDEMSRAGAFWNALDLAGFAVEADAVARAVWQAHDALAQALLDRAIDERDGPRYWAHTLYRALGIETDPDLVDLMLEGPLSGIAWGLVDGEAFAVLEALRARGCRLGILSNWGHGLAAHLAGLGLAPYFETLVVSSEEGVAKPHPDLFRIALTRAGTAPDQTAHVGDTVWYDARPARQAGMVGVLMDRWGDQPPYPGPRIQRLSELPGVLFPDGPAGDG